MVCREDFLIRRLKSLSPGRNNQDGPVNSEIQYLESKYQSSLDGISLRMEMRSLQGLKKAMPRISTKDFMGVLVASYSIGNDRTKGLEVEP